MSNNDETDSQWYIPYDKATFKIRQFLFNNYKITEMINFVNVSKPCDN